MWGQPLSFPFSSLAAPSTSAASLRGTPWSLLGSPRGKPRRRSAGVSTSAALQTQTPTGRPRAACTCTIGQVRGCAILLPWRGLGCSGPYSVPAASCKLFLPRRPAVVRALQRRAQPLQAVRPASAKRAVISASVRSECLRSLARAPVAVRGSGESCSPQGVEGRHRCQGPDDWHECRVPPRIWTA